eukprot:8330859-Alexandrium_andersonii.AAC.1
MPVQRVQALDVAGAEGDEAMQATHNGQAEVGPKSFLGTGHHGNGSAAPISTASAPRVEQFLGNCVLFRLGSSRVNKTVQPEREISVEAVKTVVRPCVEGERKPPRCPKIALVVLVTVEPTAEQGPRAVNRWP